MNRLVLLGWMLVGVFLGALPLRSAPEPKEIPSLNEAFVLRIWDSERQTHYPSIQCIAQSTDGYLWAGSYSGLIRFDGRRFTRFDPQERRRWIQGWGSAFRCCTRRRRIFFGSGRIVDWCG